MLISLRVYDNLTLPQKVELFDNIQTYLLEFDFENTSDIITLKNILFKIFKDHNENDYIRRNTLNTICNLTFLNIIRIGATSDILLDINDDDDEFILLLAIKSLFYLYNGESEIVERIESFTFHSSGDISSESYFRLGQIFLFKANEENYIENLSKAKDYFRKSFHEVENRIDAELFYHVLEILTYTDSERNSLVAIADNIWRITAFDYENKINELYFKIYECIINVFELKNKEIVEFLSPEEFNEICYYNYTILNLQLNNDIEDFYLGVFKKNIKREVLEPFFRQNFIAEKSRIKRMLNHSKSKEENDFWNYILTLINDNSDKKKDVTDIKLIISKLLPNEPTDKLMENLNGINLLNTKEILNFIGNYIDGSSISLITGSNIGDDIFKRLVAEIKYVLPNYNNLRFLEFQIVLEDIIRYVRRTTEAVKSDPNFKFLFNENSVEQDLQRSMINAFKLGSKKADYYSEENKEFADGGRVDIKYQVDNITIPLELKKTKKEITIDRIKEDYLAQAQTYTYNRDNLGFFILLDLTKKDIKKPLNNLRDLFGIIHLEPQHRINNNHPDYIIWCIVPGNKILPSQRSKYQ